jgi:hypothetical protein
MSSPLAAERAPPPGKSPVMPRRGSLEDFQPPDLEFDEGASSADFYSDRDTASMGGSLAPTPTPLRSGELGLRRGDLANSALSRASMESSQDFDRSSNASESFRGSGGGSSFGFARHRSQSMGRPTGASEGSSFHSGRRGSASGGGRRRGSNNWLMRSLTRKRNSVSNEPGTPGGKKGTPLTAPPPKIEEAKGPSVSKVLNEVMRAYANLELSGIDDAQMETLSTALVNNASVTSVNLSYNTAIRAHGLRLLGPPADQDEEQGHQLGVRAPGKNARRSLLPPEMRFEQVSNTSRSIGGPLLPDRAQFALLERLCQTQVRPPAARGPPRPPSRAHRTPPRASRRTRLQTPASTRTRVRRELGRRQRRLHLRGPRPRLPTPAPPTLPGRFHRPPPAAASRAAPPAAPSSPPRRTRR